MAGTGQFRRGTTAEWSGANPTLADGELGIERLIDGSTKIKIGDGVTHWNSLGYTSIKGDTGDKGEKGDTGTGLSRTLTSTIDFGTEQNYVEKTITDALILSSSTIIVQPVGEEYAIQGVTCGVVSISNGVSYTIYAAAPEGASDVMNINILIF